LLKTLVSKGTPLACQDEKTGDSSLIMAYVNKATDCFNFILGSNEQALYLLQ